jgi:hypothetical protein
LKLLGAREGTSELRERATRCGNILACVTRLKINLTENEKNIYSNSNFCPSVFRQHLHSYNFEALPKKNTKSFGKCLREGSRGEVKLVLWVAKPGKDLGGTHVKGTGKEKSRKKYLFFQKKREKKKKNQLGKKKLGGREKKIS